MEDNPSTARLPLLSNETGRLYYEDSYRTAFRARVLEGGLRVVLDQTAFYPTSGGQPHDTGRVGGLAVADVLDEDGRIVHVLKEPLSLPEVECEVDWSRRFDHMQQHTGQHLLSAVFIDLYDIRTLSFHMGAVSSTIELACSSLTPEQITSAELRANEIVQEDRPVSVTFEDASLVEGLRKASDRSGTLRIVSIANLDRSACGGTHVQTTGEIGAILLRSTEKIRGNSRLEFLCGNRAIRRARADFTALEAAARSFSASPDEVPALVSTQAEKLKDGDKFRRKLESELGELRGRMLYAKTEANGRGLKVHSRLLAQGPFPDDIRAEAKSFVAEGHAVFFAITEQPPAVLIASDPRTGIHAGNVLKQLFADVGGKGGGSAQIAQGSFATDPKAVLDRLDSLLAGV